VSLTPHERQLRAKLAAQSRWRSKNNPEPTRAEFTASRTATAVDHHIAALVATAPKLSARQKDKLAALL
jgi:hypothetical protein